MNTIFFIHDFLYNLVVRFSRQINWFLLIFAHLILIGLFFPAKAADFGEMAINLLLVILFMSPIAHITKSKLLMYLLKFRRPLGIAMGYAALVHALGIVTNKLFIQYVFIDNWPEAFLSSWQLVTGAVAIILVLPLLLTANKLAVKILSKNWKKLHRLVYLVFVAAAIHQQLAESGSLVEAMVMALPLIIIYSYLKLIVVYPRSLPGWPALLGFIDQKYLVYQAGKKAAVDQTVV
jgi:sulfoxide reductase heme-binding subunit YedZ